MQQKLRFLLHLSLETKPEKPRTMKKIFASLCVLALLFASCNKSEEAWTPLFNGENLDN